MQLDDQERELLEKAKQKAERNNKVYVVQFNLRNHSSKAKLIEWPKDTRKVSAVRILFTDAILN